MGVLGLVFAGVNNSGIAALVDEVGINFKPTSEFLDTLRKAGANDTLIKAITSARQFDVKGGEPTSRAEVLRHLERAINFKEKGVNYYFQMELDKAPPPPSPPPPPRLDSGEVPDSVWAELSAAEGIDPAENVLYLAEARMVALSSKCSTFDSRVVVVRVGSEGIKINAEQVQQEQLGGRLNDIFKTRAERVLFLEFAISVPVPQLLQIFQTVRNAGIDKISLVDSGELEHRCKQK